MIRIINIDLNGKLKPTDFAMKINNEYEIYYRISQDGYDIDYNKFHNMRLTIRINKTSIVDNILLNSDNIVELEGKNYISWKIPNIYLKEEALLIVDSIVKYDNINYNIRTSNYQVYVKSSPEMNGILQAISNYNKSLGLYLDSIKRREIDTPNGLIGLDSNGKIKPDKFESEFSEHIPTKLIDTLSKVENIHGLKLNNNLNKLEYYDSDDLEYYIANQIHGGKLGFKNKSEQYNIYGGNLGSYSGIIDASNFTIEVNDIVDGNHLEDNTNSYVDGGSFTKSNENENEDIYLNRIHGGFL